jgi:hypothetical protein
MKRSLLLLLAAATVQAALVPALGLDDLIANSQAIVHGRVMRSWSAWDDAHKFIWTHHMIAVIDPIRGVAPGYVVASEPGGEVGGIGMRITGAVEYAAGEEAILFLYRTPVGYWRVTGHAQGKYKVTPDLRVHTNLRGIDLVQRTPIHGVGLASLDGLSIADFKTRVRHAMRETR